MKVKKIETPNVNVTKEVSVNVENVPNTPFSVVETNPKVFKIVIGNNIISLRTFTSMKDGLNYAKRMDTIDVLNSVLLILNEQKNG